MSNGLWLLIYLGLVAEAFLVSFTLVPLTMRLARRYGFEAQPGERHVHSETTPSLGGLAIVAGFLIVLFGNLAAAHFLHPLLSERLPEISRYLVNVPSILPKLLAVIGGATLVSILGLVDDRRPLNPWLKLAVMILATLPLLAVGVRVEGFLPLPWLGSLVTVAWIVFLTNSFNFLDCMDGVSAGVAAIASLAFAAIYFFGGQWFMCAVFAVLTGALLGFLRYNFPPARTFMGDNGSLFVGYLIGSLSVLGSYYDRGSSTVLAVLTPIVVLGVPIFDTLSVMAIRLRSGQPLMQGDKNHIPHRMCDLGMSQRRSVGFLYILTATVALAAVPLRQSSPSGALALLAQVGLMLWLIHRLERTARRRRD